MAEASRCALGGRGAGGRHRPSVQREARLEEAAGRWAAAGRLWMVGSPSPWLVAPCRFRAFCRLYGIVGEISVGTSISVGAAESLSPPRSTCVSHLLRMSWRSCFEKGRSNCRTESTACSMCCDDAVLNPPRLHRVGEYPIDGRHPSARRVGWFLLRRDVEAPNCHAWKEPLHPLCMKKVR